MKIESLKSAVGRLSVTAVVIVVLVVIALEIAGVGVVSRPVAEWRAYRAKQAAGV